MDPNDLSLYVENIDWEMDGENDETIVKPPPGFSAIHVDFNMQIMQELKKDNEKLKTSHTRLFHRNVQLTSMIKAMRKMTIMAPTMASIVDEEVLNSMELDINEDKEHIFDYPAPLYDCFDCKVLRTVANGFQSQSQSVESPQENGDISSSQMPTPTPKEAPSVLSDSSEDLDFLITPSTVSHSATTANDRGTHFELPVTEAYDDGTGVQQSRDGSQFEDEYQSLQSNSSIRQLDECESVSCDYGYEFSDTNPFKQDLFSSAASSVHDMPQKIPPPLPPRPKRFSSVPQVTYQAPQQVMYNIPVVKPSKNLEVNNNTPDSQKQYQVAELNQENLPENINDSHVWPELLNSNIMNIVEDSTPYNRDFRVSTPQPDHYAQFHINTVISVNEKASDFYRYHENNPQILSRQPMREVTNSESSINSILAYSQNQMPQEANLAKKLRQCPHCVQIEISRCIMFIFFLDNEGWITIDQFRLALTNFTDILPIKQFLIEHRSEKSYRILRKNENPKMFDLIDIKTREAGHCSTIKSNVFYLIPVDGLLLKMLKALNVVPLEDIKNLKENRGVTDNPVLRDCSKLLITCIELKKHIHY